jgi:hypothetical protein
MEINFVSNCMDTNQAVDNGKTLTIKFSISYYERKISTGLEKNLKEMVDLILRSDDPSEANFFGGLDLIVKTVEQTYDSTQLYILLMMKLNEHLKVNKSKYTETDSNMESSMSCEQSLTAFESVYDLVSLPFKNFEKLNPDQVCNNSFKYIYIYIYAFIGTERKLSH